MKIEKEYRETIESGNGSLLKPGKNRVANNLESRPVSRIYRRHNRILKRSIDIILSVLVICLIFPWLLPILFIFIMIDLGFPVFFVQDRIGLNNRLFRCFKLRTMRPATNISTGRVSGTGRFLRNYKLDEVPQFINVLKGEMSIIGPRPHPIMEHRIFSEIIGETYNLRHAIKPGITGLAQVSGYEGRVTSMAELKGRVGLDIMYIRNWSFGMDCLIMLRTVGVILRGSRKQRISLDRLTNEGQSNGQVTDNPFKLIYKNKVS